MSHRVDAGEVRQRRSEIAHGIRKIRREDSKRPDSLPADMELLKLESTPSTPDLMNGVFGDDNGAKLRATRCIRKLFFKESPMIDEILNQGVVERLVEFLGRRDLPRLQIEAAWALANLVGDSPTRRDMVLDHGALGQLLPLLNVDSELAVLRTASWTLSNLCRGFPPPKYHKVYPALAVLQKLICLTDDEEVLTDTCWALFYISDGRLGQIDDVVRAGVCERLVELLRHSSHMVLIPALQTIGNISSTRDNHLDNPRWGFNKRAYKTVGREHLIEKQVLPRLYELLILPDKKSIRKEACRTISNLTYDFDIKEVIAANIIPRLVYLLRNAESDIRIEAAFAISNAICSGDPEQIRYIADHEGCIEQLCKLLNSSDVRVVSVCLMGLMDILWSADCEPREGRVANGDIKKYAQRIEDCDGIQRIEELQDHDNIVIRDKTYIMLEWYWVGKPWFGRPWVGNPLVGEPLVREPLVDKPLVVKPLVGEPLVGEPLPLRSFFIPLRPSKANEINF